MYRVASLDIDAETDINWKSLNDSTWNMWSSHFIQRKWRQLKASYDADGVMCHRGEYTSFIPPVLSA